jgi:hypothetical protein
MWRDLALLLARRHEKRFAFRIPWHKGDVSKLEPGKKTKPDKQLLNATNLVTLVKGIRLRASWPVRDLDTGKITRRGRKLSVRSACLVAALIEARAARTEKGAIAMVLEERVPRHKRLPDVYSRYQRAKALIDKN